MRGVSLGFKVATLGGAFVGGVAKYLFPTQPLNYQAWVGTIGLVVVFVSATVLLVLDKGLEGSLVEAAEAMVELERLRTGVASVRSSLDLAERRDNSYRSYFEASKILAEAACLPIETPSYENLLEISQTLLTGAMELDRSKHWSISIYQAVGPKLELQRLATRRSDRREESMPSRVWLPGQGHVGTTFARKAGMNIPDVTNPATRSALHTPSEKDRASDAERYVSIATHPIMLSGSDTQPWGVVIATSSERGWFGDDTEGGRRAEGVRLLASMIELGIQQARQRGYNPTAAD